MTQALFIALILITGYAGVRHVVESSAPAVSISGRVVERDDGQRPISGAVIAARRRGGPSVAVSITDTNGRFQLGPLEEGRFEISARRSPYLETQYGSIVWPGLGTEIAITGRAAPDEITIRMPRGGVISGTVRRLDGVPVAGAAIELFRTLLDGTLQTAGVATKTDDRGVYRMFGLEPGSYFISAIPQSGPEPARRYSAGEVDAALARLAAGRFVVPVDEPRASQTEVGTLRSYYPNATDILGATELTLALSEERLGIDISLQDMRMGRIVGVATGSNGALAGARIVLEASDNRMPGQSRVAGTGRDGSFTFEAVSPGTYDLRGMSRLIERTSQSGEPIQLSMSRVSVQSGLTASSQLSFSTGAEIVGRLQLQGRSSTNQPLSVVVTELPSHRGLGYRRRSARVNVDGSFALVGLFRAQYSVDVVGLPPGSAIGLSSQPGQATPNRLIDLTGSIRADVQLVAYAGSVISGQLLGSSPEVVKGHAVVAFPADPSLRPAWQRLTSLVVVGPDGRFSFDSLPQGIYLLCAFKGLGVLPDSPDFFAAAESVGVAVTVAKSSRVNQDLLLRER